jgi:hypothetical protein
MESPYTYELSDDTKSKFRLLLKVFYPLRRSRRGGTAKVKEYLHGVSGMSEGPHNVLYNIMHSCRETCWLCRFVKQDWNSKSGKESRGRLSRLDCLHQDIDSILARPLGLGHGRVQQQRHRGSDVDAQSEDDA